MNYYSILALLYILLLSTMPLLIFALGTPDTFYTFLII